MVAIAVCYNGSLAQGETALRPLRNRPSARRPDWTRAVHWVVQTMLDGSFPRGRKYYWKANLITDIGDSAIDVITELFARVPSAFTALGFQQLGNGTNRVAPGDTAFSHRDAR